MYLISEKLARGQRKFYIVVRGLYLYTIPDRNRSNRPEHRLAQRRPSKAQGDAQGKDQGDEERIKGEVSPWLAQRKRCCSPPPLLRAKKKKKLESETILPTLAKWSFFLQDVGIMSVYCLPRKLKIVIFAGHFFSKLYDNLAKDF